MLHEFRFDTDMKMLDFVFWMHFRYTWLTGNGDDVTNDVAFVSIITHTRFNHLIFRRKNIGLNKFNIVPFSSHLRPSFPFTIRKSGDSFYSIFIAAYYLFSTKLLLRWHISLNYFMQMPWMNSIDICLLSYVLHRVLIWISHIISNVAKKSIIFNGNCEYWNKVQIYTILFSTITCEMDDNKKKSHIFFFFFSSFLILALGSWLLLHSHFHSILFYSFQMCHSNDRKK